MAPRKPDAASHALAAMVCLRLVLVLAQDFMSGVAAAATKVEDVPVVLNQMELLHTFGSGWSIYDRIKSHYVQQWLVVVTRCLSHIPYCHTLTRPRRARSWPLLPLTHVTILCP